VDIAAPGNVILSSYPLAACAGSAAVPGDTGCYNYLSGTSMATPHVSGAAALVWSRTDVLSNSQVVEILLGSADPRGAAATRLDSWTKHGGLNIHDALSYGAPTNQQPVAHAGVDRMLADTDASGEETVTLDGSGSSDPDGAIVSYQWTDGAQIIGTGATPAVSLPVGEHTLSLTVTDDGGASSSDTVFITILPAGYVSDTVTILKAAYNSRRTQLTIEATSDTPNVTLTAYDNSNPASPVWLGEISYNPKKARYAAALTVSSQPVSLLVVSSGGGSAIAAVTGR
jgi:hypothetical protein